MFPIGRGNNLQEYGTNRNFLAWLVSKLWPVKSNMCSEFTLSLNSWLFEPYLGAFKPRLYLIGLSGLNWVFMLMTECHGVVCFDKAGVICCLSSVLGYYLQMDNFGVLWAWELKFFVVVKMTNYVRSIHFFPLDYRNYPNHATPLL